jgi:hypothetical protein
MNNENVSVENQEVADLEQDVLVEEQEVEVDETVDTPDESVDTEEVEQDFKNETNAAFAEQRRAREAAEAEAEALRVDFEISKTYGADYGVHSVEDISEKYGFDSVEEFQQSIQEQEMREEFANRGVDTNDIDEIVAKHPLVQEAKKLKQAEQERNEMNAFLDYFRQLNEREFDGTKDKLPQEVWESVKTGKKLVDAYAIYENKELTKKLKALETNEHNADSSTGSVTVQGGEPDNALTEEKINAMTDRERMRHWADIRKFYSIK